MHTSVKMHDTECFLLFTIIAHNVFSVTKLKNIVQIFCEYSNSSAVGVQYIAKV